MFTKARTTPKIELAYVNAQKMFVHQHYNVLVLKYTCTSPNYRFNVCYKPVYTYVSLMDRSITRRCLWDSISENYLLYLTCKDKS